MGVIAILQEALRIVRAHKSLLVFGFLVGLGGNYNIGGGGGDAPTPPAVPTPPDIGIVVVVALCVIAVIVGFVILKFLSTGALIEGVRRARSNGSMSVREGFREGWAHWGVLLRIALLYALVAAVSFALLSGACALVFRAFGQPALFVAIGLAVVVGVPWLVTLSILQAFAQRIAVFENRRALDAIAKARLFLHGRLQLGLKLVVASFLGVLLIGVLGIAVIAPIVLLLRASAGLWGLLPAVAIGILIVLPVVVAAISTIGVVVSSVWTIGYMTQVEQ